VKLSYGDGIFQNTISKEIEVIEFKSHNFLESNFQLKQDFQKIPPYLKGQIIYSENKTVFERPSYGAPFKVKSTTVFNTDFFSSQEMKEKAYQAFCQRRAQQNALSNLNQKINFFNKMVLPNIFKIKR